jgi:CheY-like chemotaxis protein
MKAPEVLIVEDEKLLRLMIAKLLQVSGYRVFTCGDSLQALELVEKKSSEVPTAGKGDHYYRYTLLPNTSRGQTGRSLRLLAQAFSTEAVLIHS